MPKNRLNRLLDIIFMHSRLIVAKKVNSFPPEALFHGIASVLELPPSGVCSTVDFQVYDEEQCVGQRVGMGIIGIARVSGK